MQLSATKGLLPSRRSRASTNPSSVTLIDTQVTCNFSNRRRQVWSEQTGHVACPGGRLTGRVSVFITSDSLNQKSRVRASVLLRHAMEWKEVQDWALSQTQIGRATLDLVQAQSDHADARAALAGREIDFQQNRVTLENADGDALRQALIHVTLVDAIAAHRIDELLAPDFARAWSFIEKLDA